MTHPGGEDDADELAPISKAAILLLAMGEDEAAKVLRHLEPREVQRVGAALSALGNVDSRQIDAVVNHFLETVSGTSGLTMSANEYLKNMLVGAFGEQRIGSLLERVVETNVAGLDKLKWMDSRAIADFVLREQLQIQAVVLSYLPAPQAAEVLKYFPDDAARGDVLTRVVNLAPVSAGAAEVTAVAHGGRSGDEGQLLGAVLGGKAAAAAILNHLDDSSTASAMGHIRRHDTALGDEIEALLLALRGAAASDQDDNAPG